MPSPSLSGRQVAVSDHPGRRVLRFQRFHQAVQGIPLRTGKAAGADKADTDGLAIEALHVRANLGNGPAGVLAAIGIQHKVIADGGQIRVEGGTGSALALKATLGMPAVDNGGGRLDAATQRPAVAAWPSSG